MAAAEAARAKETRCERAGLAGCSQEGPGRARAVSSGDLLRDCGPVVWESVGGSESLKRVRDLEGDIHLSLRGDEIRGRRRELHGEKEGAIHPRAGHEARETERKN